MVPLGAWLPLFLVLHVVTGRPNVLLIISDDMRPDLNCYYQGNDQPATTHPRMYTPHIDNIAAGSLLFKRAYVQFALCAPSRASFLTGRRPDSTRTYGFHQYWREQTGNFSTLPQYFREHGYLSMGYGKVFHEGDSSGDDDPPSWTEYYRPDSDYSVYRFRRDSVWEAIPEALLAETPLPDQSIAQHAVDALRKVAPAARTGNQPFFMAVGFIKPHLPFQYTREFEPYYNDTDMPLPVNKYSAIDMPRLAWSPIGVIAKFRNVRQMKVRHGFNISLPDHLIRSLRAGYYRSISFTDSMVGRVMNELRAQGLDQSTIVVFTSDHGWHLGEQAIWRKNTNFEVALKIPLMIRIPGVTDHGPESRELVELVDLFPTLVDLAGLPPLPICSSEEKLELLCTEGVSLLPLIQNPQLNFKGAAFSQYIRGQIMGYSVRTENFRYTEWVKRGPVWRNIHGKELYDHRSDPHETQNRADNSRYHRLKKKLRRILREGWRAVINRTQTAVQSARQEWIFPHEPHIINLSSNITQEPVGPDITGNISNFTDSPLAITRGWNNLDMQISKTLDLTGPISPNFSEPGMSASPSEPDISSSGVSTVPSVSKGPSALEDDVYLESSSQAVVSRTDAHMTILPDRPVTQVDPDFLVGGSIKSNLNVSRDQLMPRSIRATVSTHHKEGRAPSAFSKTAMRDRSHESDASVMNQPIHSAVGEATCTYFPITQSVINILVISVTILIFHSL